MRKGSRGNGLVTFIHFSCTLGMDWGLPVLLEIKEDWCPTPKTWNPFSWAKDNSTLSIFSIPMYPSHYWLLIGLNILRTSSVTYKMGEIISMHDNTWDYREFPEPFSCIVLALTCTSLSIPRARSSSASSLSSVPLRTDTSCSSRAFSSLRPSGVVGGHSISSSGQGTPCLLYQWENMYVRYF